MGNRAVVTVEGSKVGVYLHWNGGAESINAFLKAAKDLEIRDPVDDPTYFYARFTQMIANWFGDTTSIGVGDLETLDTDNGDNGVYVIGADFKIVKRLHGRERDRSNKKKTDEIYDQVMKINLPIFKKTESEVGFPKV